MVNMELDRKGTFDIREHDKIVPGLNRNGYCPQNVKNLPMH